MPDDQPDGRSFEDVARALADEVNRAVERLSAIDLEDIARAANDEAERARRWIEDLARSLTQTRDAATRTQDAPAHHAGPHPLAMPTAQQGVALIWTAVCQVASGDRRGCVGLTGVVRGAGGGRGGEGASG